MIDFIIDTQENSSQQVVFGTSDGEHVTDLVRFCKGWHKFFPFIGACLLESVADEAVGSELYSQIRQELQNDGAQLQQLTLVPSAHGIYQLHIEANYG